MFPIQEIKQRIITDNKKTKLHNKMRYLAIVFV